MRKQPTQAQREASQARRAAFRELARKVGAMTDAERQEMASKGWPTTVDGHPLSGHNACLVMIQQPGATILGGFQQWRRAGRKVRKGGHGVLIWVPTKGSRNRADGEAEGVEDDGARPGFIPAYVFDVSQTEPVEAGQEVAA